MTRGPITPPQAYTRDQLTAAFAWIQTQPESVRKMADTAESLMAMFLRAKRNGDLLNNSAPVSEKNFKESLKTLKAELDQFSDDQANVPTPTPVATAHSFPQMPSPTLSPEVKFEEPAKSYHPVSQSSSKAQIRNSDAHWMDEMDSRSRDILQKVQDRFNLSSESEALRMLLVLGFEKAQSLFEK